MKSHAASLIRIGSLALAVLANLPSAQARGLDNFDDNAKTDWKDFTFVPGLGLPTETGGRFKFALPNAGQALFTASTWWMLTQLFSKA